MSLGPYSEKFSRLRRIVQANGGWLRSLFMLYRTDDLKEGKLIGEDKFGNKYYQNDVYFFSSNRWVVFSEKANVDYNGTQIPPEWHRWIHYITDETPVDKPPVRRKWMQEHSENPTGTDKIYVPYSTTRPKIEAWKPPQSS